MGRMEKGTVTREEQNRLIKEINECLRTVYKKIDDVETKLETTTRK